ncbi:MAG: transcriptional repressor LexA [Ruminococcus sp.]|jgi:repressor LexA|nr:transcriptional repressor LexA [Ruminococcus sp.]
MKDKLRAVYDFIKEKIETEGYAPSVREICSALNIGSTSTAARYINSLVDEGLLEKSDGKNRAVKLTGKSSTRIPLIGTITAGQPITALEDVTDYINFHTDKKYYGNLFALRVRGDSMIKAYIMDGDIAVIEKAPTCANGDIAAVMLDGNATLKRFFKENGRYRLQPENDEMEPILSDSCEVLGKLVSILRYY